MKKSKFTDEQIAYALKQAELGTPVAEVCRKISSLTRCLMVGACARSRSCASTSGFTFTEPVRIFVGEAVEQRVIRAPA